MGQALRVAVVLDHDIVIRNFVMSGVLRELCQKHGVHFIAPEAHRRVRLDVESLVPEFHRVHHVKVDEQRAFRQRRLYQATVFRNSRGGAESQTIIPMWHQYLGPRGYWQTWAASLPGIYQAYRAWARRQIGPNVELNRLLNDLNPDLIFHPTVLEGLFVDDLVTWGRANKVKTVFAMNSWDNPATKAMISEHPDRLIVWGEHSKQDAIRHMRTPPESIIKLGAAQYDVYRRAPKVDPATWRAKMSISPNTLALLYAGSNQGLNETGHLMMLDNAIEEGKLPNCVVVYRPHPWRPYPPEEHDFFGIGGVGWRHVKMDPSCIRSYQESRKSGRVMVELADYEDTHLTLGAVDAVVSPLSSILLEAALHGKPVAAYTAGIPIRKFYQAFFDRVLCQQIDRPEDLVRKCATILRQARDESVAKRLAGACIYFVAPSERPYGERLVEVLENV